MPQALRTREEFIPYIRKLADLLRLKDWTIEVAEDPPEDDDHAATFTPIIGRKLGTIEIGESTLQAGATEQRHTITHELIHAHFSLVESFIQTVDERNELLDKAIEYGVDALADVLAPYLPLPGDA